MVAYMRRLFVMQWGAVLQVDFSKTFRTESFFAVGFEDLGVTRCHCHKTTVRCGADGVLMGSFVVRVTLRYAAA